MSAGPSATDVLTTIARAMVVADAYPTVEDALQGMALEQIRRKVAAYRRRIREFERKYGADFQVFSGRLLGRATPSEEDDWLEWRSALEMLDDWQRTFEKLSGHTSN
jgi:hypothetical protein